MVIFHTFVMLNLEYFWRSDVLSLSFSLNNRWNWRPFAPSTRGMSVSRKSVQLPFSLGWVLSTLYYSILLLKGKEHVPPQYPISVMCKLNKTRVVLVLHDHWHTKRILSGLYLVIFCYATDRRPRGHQSVHPGHHMAQDIPWDSATNLPWCLF